MLREEFITAHIHDLELYGKACQEFGNDDKETVLGKWYDKYCLYQEDSVEDNRWMLAVNRLLMSKGLQYEEYNITWPYSQNNKYLLIEDEKVGKGVWSHYMGDKVTVVCPSDFDTHLHGNGGIKTLLTLLEPREDITLYVLPDSVDIYKSPEIVNLWSDIKVFCALNGFTLFDKYIGFEWIFIKDGICKKAAEETSTDVAKCHTEVSGVCNNVTTQEDYISVLSAAKVTLNSKKSPTLENICAALTSKIHRSTGFCVDKDYIGKGFTPDLLNSIMSSNFIISEIERSISNVEYISV